MGDEVDVAKLLAKKKRAELKIAGLRQEIRDLQRHCLKEKMAAAGWMNQAIFLAANGTFPDGIAGSVARMARLRKDGAP